MASDPLTTLKHLFAGATAAEAHVYPHNVNYEEGIRRVAGNKKLYDRLLRQMAEELPAILESIQKALERSDFFEAKSIAHSLKGSSGNLAITLLHQKASTLEAAVQAEDSHLSAKSFASLSVEAALFLNAIKASSL